MKTTQMTAPPGLEVVPASGEQRFVTLVDNVKQCQPEALEELYGLVKNFTYFVMRQLGAEDLQDSLHDIFLAVVQAIREDKLRNPERLTAFLTAVTRFHTYSRIERRVRSRSRYVVLDGKDIADPVNLEQRVYRQQKRRIVAEMLRTLSPLDREVLRRFYLEDQGKERICRDLQLTPNQFRNVKSQAKLLLTAIGRRHVRRPAAVERQSIPA
jgi:RNA polymerase sigma factor (sigma-70 family)